MLVYPSAVDARWGNLNSSKFAWASRSHGRFVDGDPHFVCSRREPKVEKIEEEEGEMFKRAKQVFDEGALA